MSLNALWPGMIVGKSVIDKNGNVLLYHDVVLTERFIKGLILTRQIILLVFELKLYYLLVWKI